MGRLSDDLAQQGRRLVSATIYPPGAPAITVPGDEILGILGPEVAAFPVIVVRGSKPGQVRKFIGVPFELTEEDAHVIAVDAQRAPILRP